MPPSSLGVPLPAGINSWKHLAPKLRLGLQLETPVSEARLGARVLHVGNRSPHRGGTAATLSLRPCPGRGAATRQRERPTYLGDLQPPLPCPLAIWVPAHEDREVREGDVPRPGPELPGRQHRPPIRQAPPTGVCQGSQARQQSWQALQGKQNRTKSPEAPWEFPKCLRLGYQREG